jgi:hypothetical protein
LQRGGFGVELLVETLISIFRLGWVVLQWFPGGVRTPPVPVTELLGCLLGLFRFGGHWGGGERGGSGGSGTLGRALLLALVLGELAVLDQEI